LAGSIPIFKKNSKRYRFSKNKVNRLQPGFARSTRRVSRVTPGHGLSYFFINPAQFQPQVDSQGRVSKLWFKDLNMLWKAAVVDDKTGCLS